MDIFLSDRAFVGIVVSSIEVYKDECVGALLGYQTPNRIVVEYAIPFQTAMRKPTGAEPNWRRESKVKEVLPKLINLQHLGYFHSHPQWGKQKSNTKLSNTDRDSMSKGSIEIVVAINDVEKSRKWYTSRQELCGSLDKYHIRIAGYYKRKKDEEIKQYPIRCPYVLGFDQTF